MRRRFDRDEKALLVLVAATILFAAIFSWRLIHQLTVSP